MSVTPSSSHQKIRNKSEAFNNLLLLQPIFESSGADLWYNDDLATYMDVDGGFAAFDR